MILMKLEAFPEEKAQILINVQRELDRKFRFNQNVTQNFQKSREKMLQKFEAFRLPENPEEERRRIHASNGLWDILRSRVAAPDTMLRETWNVLLLLAILYNAIAVPFRIAFLTKAITFLPDYILDLFFLFVCCYVSISLDLKRRKSCDRSRTDLAILHGGCFSTRSFPLSLSKFLSS